LLDGETVGVASDIVEDVAGPAKGSWGVDHPLGVPDRSQMPPERGWFMKVEVRRRKGKITAVKPFPDRGGTSLETSARAL